jgi:peptide/nickel transport system substrate-binding protein
MLAVALAASVARAETRPPYGGRAVASLPSPPASLDPLAAQSAAEIALAGLVFDTLYRLDADGRPVPHLAVALPAATTDPLVVRIAVRDGARFHDGRPVRAADVAASLGRAHDSWPLARVARVGTDAGEVVITLRQPAPELAAWLAQPQLGITPLGRAPAPGKPPVGSGPFKVKRLDARAVELEASGDHFAGRPYLDGLTLRWFEDGGEEARAYEAGEADLSLRGAVAFSGHEPKHPTTVHEGPATLLTYIGFGTAHKLEPGFRRGVSAALNRATLRHVGTGEHVVPTAYPTAAGGPAEIAVPLRADGPLELLVDRGRPDDVDVATRVVAALDRAGVAASYTALPSADYARRVAARQCDLYIGQLVAPPGELAGYLAAFAAGGERFDAATAADAAAAFAARRPIVPLFYRSQRASHKKTLGGVGFDAFGMIGWADAYLWTGPDSDP